MKKIVVFSFIVLNLLLSGCTSDSPTTETETYEVTWIDEEGNELHSSDVDEGDVPSYSYSITDSDEWDYTFEGWSDTQSGSVISSLPEVSEDTTYYAVVSKVKQQYTIEFETNDGSTLDSVPLDYGDTLTEIDVVTKTGFNFTGWFSDSSLSTTLSLPLTVTEDVTLYAGWEVLEFDITWYDELGNQIEVTTVSYDQSVSNTYNPTDTAEWDYTFDGWSSTQGGSILNTLPNATSDVSYYAVVSQEKQQYTVSFESNQGSDVTSLTVDYGTELTTLDEPIREGFNFVSWTTDVGLSTNVSLPVIVTEDMTLYASWNETIPFAGYLQMLFDTYTQNPYSELPDSMLPSSFVIAESDIIDDYSTFTNIVDIPYQGFGEQWDMVLGNMDQTSSFSELLTVVETLSTLSVTVYNNFLDTNPANTESHQFTEGIYTITIEVDGDYIYYLVEYSGDIPGFGVQDVSMELGYDFVNNVKETRIQIGEDNVLKYEVSEDYYKFGISYLGFRDAYFEMNFYEDGTIEGAIFEYLTYQDYSLESAAQFLIDDEYAYVIGNKVSGLPGFAGTIVEVYDVTNGELIGYEVQETLSLVTFNTLWFKLDDQTGKNNIKVTDVINDMNMNSVYVNDGADLFEAKLVGGLLNPKQASRRYDIELRTMYIYTEENGVYTKVQMDVPMLFVQEENLDSLESDIVNENSSVSSFTLDVSTSDITTIQDAYTTYIPIFILNKDNIGYENIRVYLDLTIPE